MTIQPEPMRTGPDTTRPPAAPQASQAIPSIPPPVPSRQPPAVPQTSAASSAVPAALPSGEAYPAPSGSLPTSNELRREAQRTAQVASRPTSPEEDVERASRLLKKVTRVFAERVVGQEQLRVALLSTLISGGHVLLESVPGLAKTTAAQTLASAVSGSFHRI